MPSRRSEAHGIIENHSMVVFYELIMELFKTFLEL